MEKDLGYYTNICLFGFVTIFSNMEQVIYL